MACLFRVWDGRRMLKQETVLLSPNGSVYIVEMQSLLWGEYTLKKIEYFKFMRCTGLKDKNDVYMFEGDIVLINSGGNSYITTIIWGEKHNYPALDLDFNYIPQDWYFDSNVLSTIMNNNFETITVIGNIYENKKLKNSLGEM